MTGAFFFFNDTATTEIYTLSLHAALPIYAVLRAKFVQQRHRQRGAFLRRRSRDRKSTRLNSSHLVISYAVFCLKKKNHGPVVPYLNREIAAESIHDLIFVELAFQIMPAND